MIFPPLGKTLGVCSSCSTDVILAARNFFNIVSDAGYFHFQARTVSTIHLRDFPDRLVYDISVANVLLCLHMLVK